MPICSSSLIWVSLWLQFMVFALILRVAWPCIPQSTKVHFHLALPTFYMGINQILLPCSCSLLDLLRVCFAFKLSSTFYQHISW